MRSVGSSDRQAHPKCRAVIGGDAWNHGRASASARAHRASLLDRAVCQRHASDERRARSDEALEDDHRACARAPSGARCCRARCVRPATRRPRRANRSVAVPAFPEAAGETFAIAAPTPSPARHTDDPRPFCLPVLRFDDRRPRRRRRPRVRSHRDLASSPDPRAPSARDRRSRESRRNVAKRSTDARRRVTPRAEPPLTRAPRTRSLVSSP